MPAKKKKGSVTPKKKVVRKKSPSSKYVKVKKDDSATLKRLRKSYPNNAVVPIRNSSSYRIIGKNGRGSMTITPGKRKKPKKK